MHFKTIASALVLSGFVAGSLVIPATANADDHLSFKLGRYPRLTAPAHPIALCALDAMHQLSGNSSNAA